MENDNVIQAALKRWAELAGEQVPTYLSPLQDGFRFMTQITLDMIHVILQMDNIVFSCE